MAKAGPTAETVPNELDTQPADSTAQATAAKGAQEGCNADADKQVAVGSKNGEKKEDGGAGEAAEGEEEEEEEEDEVAALESEIKDLQGVLQELKERSKDLVQQKEQVCMFHMNAIGGVRPRR